MREQIMEMLEDELRRSKRREGHEAIERDGAILLSVALEHGVPLRDLQRTVTRRPDGQSETAVGRVIDRLAQIPGAVTVEATEVKRSDGLTAAINSVGGLAALAQLLKINDQAVRQWERVPVERLLQIEQVTGVSRHLLRPDLFQTGGAL